MFPSTCGGSGYMATKQTCTDSRGYKLYGPGICAQDMDQKYDKSYQGADLSAKRSLNTQHNHHQQNFATVGADVSKFTHDRTEHAGTK